MPGFQDSAFIVLLALLLFGPKKLPVLARQLGKLMADFRRASNEFRSQMEDELRISEQADRQKQIAAIEAAAPTPPAIDVIPEPEHPHIPRSDNASDPGDESSESVYESEAVVPEPTSAPVPIATSGELSIMPPATGLPIANTSLSSFVDSIPEVSAPEASTTKTAQRIDARHDAPLEAETLHG